MAFGLGRTYLSVSVALRGLPGSHKGWTGDWVGNGMEKAILLPKKCLYVELTNSSKNGLGQHRG